MLKRILAVATGVAAGVCLSVVALRVGDAWSLLPHRELSRNVSYFREVLDTVSKNYVEPKDAGYAKLTKAALQGMVASLDPHSEFLDARDFDETEEELRGDFGGIGLQVEMRGGKVVVVAPLAGTPGERAGFRRGDQIVRIDGKGIERLHLDDVIRRLRGQPKTKVSVTIFRPSEKRTSDLTVVREIVKLASVRGARMIEPGFGYVEITQFSERTGEEFAQAVGALEKQGLRGLVIDLRNNPGGLLEVAVGVVEPFFNPDELIVFTQGPTPESREELRAGGDARGTHYPIAVLVNAGSASAAEIVAGALKDTGRAVIVGERSFGKGSVQTVIKLRDGDGLRLTTAKYYTPRGISIHEKGIEPQVPVVVSEEDDDRLRLQHQRDDCTDSKDFEEHFGFAPIGDRQLQTAVEMLKGALLYAQSFQP